jgi:glycosyltransferase involved in cell wall biosynthesis
MPRLLLLSGRYPRSSGDASFVASEMGALAEAFDEVVVFSFARSDDAHIELPPRVRYAGNLYGDARWKLLRGLLDPRLVARAALVTIREHRGVRLPGGWRLHSAACLLGMRIASDPRVRAELGPDTVVYSFWGLGGGLALPWLAPDVAGTAVRLHGSDLYEEPRPLPLRRALVEGSDAVLAVSTHGAEYLARRHPAAAARIRILRLGVPAQPVGNPPADPGEHGLTILSVSSLIPLKRVDRILAAAELVASKRPVLWVHVGDGPVRSAIEAAVRAAQQRAPALRVELAGQLAHAAVLDLYRQRHVDVLVNASSSEGAPVSVMEALSFGVPTIVTAVGGSPELVAGLHPAGIVVGPDADAAELAMAITLVAAERDRFEPRLAWADHCDRDANAAVVAGLMRGLADRGDQARR